MSVNSSSSTMNYFYHCSNATVGILISRAFIITHIFLLFPLSLLVLYLGHQRWCQQRSVATTSHSDIFTYHWAAMELITTLGATFYFSGLSKLITVGTYMLSNSFPGQISLHILTCVERYLAVVHPVTYLGLRQSGGVSIRNIGIGCVWLLYCVWIGVKLLYFPNLPSIPIICFVVLALVVVSFCSLSILCVLTRPGPGEMGGNKERVDQSKQRVFHTIMAITGVLWLFFLASLVPVALEKSDLLSYNDWCLVLLSGNFLTLPSSLVLPLLFLHRAGKQRFLLFSPQDQ